MIKIKIFRVDASDAYASGRDGELGALEEFIALIGYHSIKEIKIQSASAHVGYYHIIYEDNLPYAPRPIPEKKGLFG